MAETIDALVHDPTPVFPQDLKTLARTHFQRALLDRSSSAALCMAQDRGRWECRYFSSVLFNLERLVGEDAVNRSFAAFVPLYRQVDETGLQREILKHFHQADPALGGALEDLMRIEPAEFVGIKGRSLANVLFHARQLEASHEKPGARLPSVALWRLGVTPPQYTGTRPGGHRTRRRRPYAKRPVLTLPLLEYLSKKAPILEV